MGSYGNNITISYPGDDWQLLWPDALPNFQLDIVGFLAILGEDSILANAQVSALSRLFYLPRLLPAPQALLKVTRPQTLPSELAYVTAVKSGNNKAHLNHVANILLGTSEEQLKKHWVRCVTITKTPPKDTTYIDRIFRGSARQATTLSKEGERMKTQPSTVKAKAAGPLTWVTLLGVALTVNLFICSLVYGDGMSLMAVIALSLLSSICGIANKWELNLPPRGRGAVEDQTDEIVIRYPEGSFLIVKCTDEIARELFFAPEEINYSVKNSSMYRLLALVGSVALMFGVILLANARLELQIGWAGSYLILNAAHWAAAALPAKMHWDLSCYNVEEEGIFGGPKNDSFTMALWKVILVTRSSRWVRINGAAPATPAWDDWVKECRAAALRRPEPDHKGKLTDPVPDWNKTGTGTVWVAPDGFDAKAAYNKLDEEYKARLGPGGEDEETDSLEEGRKGITQPEAVLGAQVIQPKSQ